jgi:hypothetical protein
LVEVAKNTSTPRHDLSLSKTRIASTSLLSTTVVLGYLAVDAIPRGKSNHLT